MPVGDKHPPDSDHGFDFDELQDVLDTAAHDAGHDDFTQFATDLLTKMADGKFETARTPEPPDETRYRFHDEDFDGGYDEAAGRMTKAVAAVTPRNLGMLDFWGPVVGRAVDEDALAVLTAVPGVRHTDDELAGEIRATVETVAALADLYSHPVDELILTDVEGDKIVERRDGHYLWFWLPEDRLDRVTARLPSIVVDAIERVELQDTNETE